MTRILRSVDLGKEHKKTCFSALELAAKYACMGPRYTSYPTAQHFKDGFELREYLDWQRTAGDQNSAPLSLYIHLPFCHDTCYSRACNKVVPQRKDVAREYLTRLQTEIEKQSSIVGKNRPITQMHWAGGTTTYLDQAEITELMHVLASNFRLSDKQYREYSINLDPRSVDIPTIALLKGLGFNRISLGIQDFDPLEQKAINRVQPYNDIISLVECVRLHGFRSLSFDLIYGLPHQDSHTIAETLRQVVALRPDRITYYNYAHLPGRFSSQRSIDRITLPTPEKKLVLQDLISNTLKDAGYHYIGMDHYVLPEDELALAQKEGRLQRNFNGYSLQMADDLLGLGVSAISQIGDYYLQNERDLASYCRLIDNTRIATATGYRLNDSDKLRRHIIMNIVSDLKLDIAECNDQFGIDFNKLFASQLKALRRMQADGLVSISDQEIAVTTEGRPFLCNICMPFDAYLDTTHSGKPPPKLSVTL